MSDESNQPNASNETDGFNVSGSSRSKKMLKAMIDQIEQLLTNSLGDALSLKLNATLVKLQSVLHSSVISHEALAAALADAVMVISAANAEKASVTPQQKVEMLWREVEHYNHEIDDGFEKMRKSGIIFDAKLWAKHKTLSNELQGNPHDLAKQKELDAVDDALLLESAQQLKDHPEAKPYFDDVKKKSDQRHKAVDEGLSRTLKSVEAANATTEMDWQQSAKDQGKEVSLNDVESQNVGSKANSSQKFVRKQTNVCFRTKLLKWCRFFLFLKIAKP